ncbi:hypothetical protein ACHWQZ_G015076 [Mnemiopsis leidyi]
MSRFKISFALMFIVLLLVDPGLTKKKRNKKKDKDGMPDDLTSCSGFGLRDMQCHCLFASYNVQCASSGEFLELGSKNCLHYETYCAMESLPLHRRNKNCCRALLCHMERKNCG